ncbi:MAG: hypothetical protein ALECFALPRED_004233 [Alectoria fallacina]|uniref:CCAAT-binding factor domain-containing protein n=1 Tax=Alectoria fallacina TaxID=1903189 RepID=A0A8H3FWJ9_9LECA|nr:MAG: hypothetical protein ALECFALPRED_004233 [Alectoria fallacina]
MPAKSMKLHASESPEDHVPDFNPDVLRSLTEKIESGFKIKGKGAISKGAPARPKTQTSKVKRKGGEQVTKAPVSTSAVKAVCSGSTEVGKQKPTVALKASQGKKRLRDGRVKEESYRRMGDDANTIMLGTRNRKSESGNDTSIDEEVRALGGTEEDVSLIADVISESELEGGEAGLGKNLGNGLEKEILQLARQLRVDRMGEKISMAEFESDEADEADNIEDSGYSDMIPSSKVTNGAKPALQNATSVGKGQRSLIFQPRSEWHAVVLPPVPLPSQEASILPSGLLDSLHNHAKTLLENENTRYAESNRSASSAHQFYSTIMSTGTLSDKISALTLSVQESPVHNVKALESLVGLAGKRSRGQAVEVLGALKDLFGPGNLLPSERKLRTFASQPALSAVFDPIDFQWTSRDPLPKEIKEVHLISWAYEDWLKSTFFEILRIIETWCNDEVVFARVKAVNYVCQLLKEKPEQEANLLRLLVNKLGDSDKKVASKTSFNVLQLEVTHPLMKPTIIAAIESDLLFRPGQSLHAKYYATITLNQTVLSGKEGDVARKLLDIYFSLFVKLLEKPEEAKIVVPGVNAISINKNGEVQGGGGSAGKKAQKKTAEKEKATIVDEDLREKMLSAVLTGVNRAMPFTDTNDESFERHLDTLFKVTHSSNFNTSIQALMLIQQLNRSHQGSVDRFHRTLYESLLDPRLLTSSKQALYLNLLFRALRSDLNVERVKAFTKRLLQVVAMNQPSFICGSLYLLRELEGVFANLEAFINQAEEDSDDEEDFRDVQEQLPKGNNLVDGPSPTRNTKPTAKYDGRKRDPKYSNADRSSLWEVTPFLQHYHPSVSLFATRVLTHSEMPPKPDLSLNTLIHFLDRFVYRNPKITSAPRGASIMQPMAGGDSSALLVSAYSNKSSTKQPVNLEVFWKQESDKVNADEVFFHKYFSTLGMGKKKASKKKTERKADAEDNEDDSNEDEIWKALLGSRPELDEGSDSGFGDEDIESDMEDQEDDELDSEFGEEDKSVDGAPARDAGDFSDPDEDEDEDEDEAFFDSDEEVPSDLKKAFHKEVTSSQPEPVVEAENEKRGGKRRRLKKLPTFASAEDYAMMLEEDD